MGIGAFRRLQRHGEGADRSGSRIDAGRGII